MKILNSTLGIILSDFLQLVITVLTLLIGTPTVQHAYLVVLLVIRIIYQKNSDVKEECNIFKTAYIYTSILIIANITSIILYIDKIRWSARATILTVELFKLFVISEKSSSNFIFVIVEFLCEDILSKFPLFKKLFKRLKESEEKEDDG